MNEIVVNLPSFESLNFPTIVPMLVAIVGAVFILIIDLINKNLDKSLYVMLAVLFLLIDFAFVYNFNYEVRGFFDLLLLDGISLLANLIIVAASILFILTSMNKLRYQESRYPEFFALFLFMIAGFQFMVSSDSLILIFVGMETSSMALYTLIAMHNRNHSLEAAIKYFTMGALATAFFAFGAMIFYVLTASVELSQISQVLYESGFENYAFVLLGFIFILGALGFKLSLVPYHTWVADVYEGSTSLLAGFLSIVPKIAGFIVALRFFEIFIASGDLYVEIVLYITVVLTMTLPNVIALLQNDLKRMLAYSSISNAGFVFAAILIGTTQATTSLFLYWILFLITNFGVFTMLWLNEDKNKSFSSSHDLAKYKGLVKTSPKTAIIFGIFFLSLAGLPPFALFWGKLYLIGSAINAGYTILAVIMVVNSAIAAYYYLKPLVVMFLQEADEKTEHMKNSTKLTSVLVGFFAFLVVVSIFYINSLIEFISYYVQISGF